MQLDYATLTVAGGLVAVVSGLLLLFAWTQYDNGRSALRLGASHLAGGIGLLFLALGWQQDARLTFAAQPAFVLAAFLAVASTLAFEGRGRLAPLLVGATFMSMGIIWLNLAGFEAQTIRTLQLGIVTPLYFVAGFIMWRGRREKFRARLPLVLVFVLHGITNSIGLLESHVRQALPFGVPSFSDWYGLIHIESMIYLMGSTMLMVALIKERSEAGHRIASLTDTLTGLPNRRAFLYACERTLERCRREGAAATVLAVDLDRFKAVNDTFGHAAGDRVLEEFAVVAQQLLRPSDLIGRLGGEEFAVLLPRTGGREGEEVAERLRAEFARAARIVGGHEIGGTLSVGVAAVGAETTLGEVLERADAALYRAKLNGRDRVELDGGAADIRLVSSLG